MASFQFDIKGQLNSMRLTESKALWPLFETVVNAIQAIDESAEKENGKITILAQRENYEQLTLDGDSVLGRFVSFSVMDNGIGMNEGNYNSFNTAYSTYKISKGCKGIGRFLWLLAFENIQIESVYKEGDKYFRRNFVFNRDGVEPDDNAVEIAHEETGTTVILQSFFPVYRNSNSVPVSLEILANKIIEHCLPFFISGNCPSILLKDDISDPINLNSYYETRIKDTLHRDEFELNNSKYTIYHLMLREGGNAHRIHFCANNLDVNSIELKNYMPNLQKKILSEDEDGFYYDGYISSEYLDSVVNSSRTGFAFDEDEEQASVYGADKETIISTAVEYINIYLGDYLDDINRSKREQIDRFVADDRPMYRYLLKQKPEIYDRIPAGLNYRQLEMELHKHVQEWENEIKVQAKKLEKVKDDNLDVSYNELFEKYWTGVTELSKTCLAEYVTRRKSILEILENALTIQENGKFKREEVIHSIICPMRHTSDDVSFDEMNLWIIDERLAYHQFLASDKTIQSLPGVDSKSTKEVDLAVFNRAFAYTEDDSPLNTITIVEFKKPDNKKDNPLSQMGRYIDEIKSGKKKRASGLSFGNCENTAFRCFAICDDSEKMRENCRNAGLRVTPDGQGYYGYWPERNAYVEMITYNKLLADARKRNQVLFDKLFEPKLTEIIHIPE